MDTMLQSGTILHCVIFFGGGLEDGTVLGPFVIVGVAAVGDVVNKGIRRT